MRREQAFPSQYLSKDDVSDGPVALTIKDVLIESVQTEGGVEDKPVLHFREPDAKRMILNVTNWTTCEEAYGPDTDTWIGRSVEAYLDPGVVFAGRKVGGVRLRIPGNAVLPLVAPGIAGSTDAILKEIGEIIRRMWPGKSQEDRAMRLQLVTACLQVRSWNELAALVPDALTAGLDLLRRLEARSKEEGGIASDELAAVVEVLKREAAAQVEPPDDDIPF